MQRLQAEHKNWEDYKTIIRPGVKLKHFLKVIEGISKKKVKHVFILIF